MISGANVDQPKGTLNSPRQTYTLNTNDQLLKVPCEVLLPGGTRLQGINVNRASVGAAVQCSVRPERITLADATRAAQPDGNLCAARYLQHSPDCPQQ